VEDCFLPPPVDEADDPGALDGYSSLQEAVLESTGGLEGTDVDSDDSGPVEVAPPVDEVEVPYGALLEL
jgi:hypothetical protein